MKHFGLTSSRLNQIALAAFVTLMGLSAFAGGSGGGGTRDGKQVLCQDAWGNFAQVSLFNDGLKIHSDRYGKTGLMKFNGSSQLALYFRDFEGTAIVRKSLLTNGIGSITYVGSANFGRSESLPVRLTCTQP